MFRFRARKLSNILMLLLVIGVLSFIYYGVLEVDEEVSLHGGQMNGQVRQGLLLHPMPKKEAVFQEPNVEVPEIPINVEEKNIFGGEHDESTEESAVDVGERSTKRLRILREACKAQGHLQPPEAIFTNDTLFDKVLKGAVRTMYVDDKHKLILCQMPKVGCSNWKRFFLIATGMVNTTDPNDIKHGMFYGGPQLVYKLKWLYTYSREEIMHRLKTYYKFVFTRNPFERILSAYRDKLEDVRPFIGVYLKKHGTKIIAQFRTNATVEALRKGNDVKFEEFVKYIMTGVYDFHWGSYERLCQPCTMPYDFLGKMETIQEDVAYITNLAGIDIKYPETETRNASLTSAQKLAKYYANVPIEDLRALHKWYSNDLQVFNYTYPESLKTLLGDNL